MFIEAMPVHGRLAPHKRGVLQIRDITTKEEWWQAYSLVIPVLTFARADGSSEVSPMVVSQRDECSCHCPAAYAC